MLKTSCISSSPTRPRSWISSKIGGYRQRVVDLVADVGGEAAQVGEAAGGGCGRDRAHFDLGAQQLQHRLDVDLGRLKQDVAERSSQPPFGILVEGQAVQGRAGQGVAVGMDPRGGQAEHRVAGPHRGAVDDRVEGDGAEAGSGDVEAAHHLAQLGQLASRDLDPGQLRAPGQADADLLADLRVGALDRDVVEHRQRLGADADHVVDVHRDAVDADRVEAAQLLSDQELGADPVGGERDPGPLVDPDHAGVMAGQWHLPRGSPQLDRPQRPHQPGDRGVSRPLVDPCLGVGVVAHLRPSFARTAAASTAR
jgi:hypothetical protein